MSTGSYVELQQVAGPVSRETFELLKQFESLFQLWARRINLVAPSTLDDVWRRHILDSAQLWPFLLRSGSNVLDLGSGAGFPGLVLAILVKGEEVPGTISLVDSNRKKTSFLQNVVGTLSLPAKIYGKRIESVSREVMDTPHFVTARALTSLDSLLSLSAPWLTRGARGLFHKGRDYQREIEESAHQWQFDLVKHASKIDDESVVLEVINLKRR
ncbi:MAG: 16S rRNA (guanine(527)-N(7))-methyltransferase RsmG [Rhizobiaceae bacterium]|nr:16S rRNA (guanine(527)-N(7))-methyltransferase RsmG [Rhizobiaceae bacterium]